MAKKKVTSIHDGKVEVRDPDSRWRGRSDRYHLILALRWPAFLLLLAGSYLAINLIFAIAYWLVPGSVEHARQGSFLDVLFFSIETFATVGYGEMTPGSLAGHMISTVEIMVGLMSLAVTTGLTFARFSKPTARVKFSESMVIRDFSGKRVLMVRIANARLNRILEPTANVGLVRSESTSEGETYHRIHDLVLQRRRNPVFSLTWTLIHTIDETSPLAGWDKAALIAADSRITVSVTGHDETIAASVYALHEYTAEQIFFDHRFVDIFSEGIGGAWMIDLTRFNDIVPYQARL